MLYDIDVFGFTCGYITKNWSVMSEEDLLSDRKLSKRFLEAKYQVWKRHNIVELTEIYNVANLEYRSNFEKFCREYFRKTTNFHHLNKINYTIYENGER